jgi:hypothetical protein
MPRAKSSNQEGRMLLAEKSIKEGQIKSIRGAADIYDVPDTTLGHRIRGRPSRDDCTPNSRKLTPCEEEAII